jgi:sulfite reductase (ferredoxin)
VLGSPLTGIAEDEVLDITPAIADITGRLLSNPEYSNLPRKFKTAISGLQDVAHEINDVAFVGVHHPEHGPGLDVWVGGGLSTNPKIAQRLGAWVPLAEAGDVWEAVVALFRDHGYRRLRNKARLKFLVVDWGVEKFRAVLEEEYLHRRLIDGPPPPQLLRPRDHVGVQRQKDGLNAVGVAPVAGRVGGTRLVAAAAAAERAGSRRVRITPMQKLVVLDIPDDKVEELIAELGAIGLPARPSPWRRATMACTGDEFCKYGIVETKARAARLIDELEERLADVQDTLESPISIHLNGCPNSCARIQVADIGLKGMTLSASDSSHEDAFQVHLGGALGFDATFGRKVRGNKVRSADAADYIERVVRRYADQRSPRESFAQWVARASDTDLAV